MTPIKYFFLILFLTLLVGLYGFFFLIELFIVTIFPIIWMWYIGIVFDFPVQTSSSGIIAVPNILGIFLIIMGTAISLTAIYWIARCIYKYQLKVKK